MRVSERLGYTAAVVVLYDSLSKGPDMIIPAVCDYKLELFIVWDNRHT